MLTYQISEADLADANYERFHHQEALVQKRMHTLFLKGHGYEQQTIADILSLHRNTVGTYLRLYREGGMEALRQVNYQGSQSPLRAHHFAIERTFREQPPQSAQEAAARIEQLTGIKRSARQILDFMRDIGMRPLKTGHIPAKADPQAQQQFLTDKLEPLLEKSAAGQCHLFFLDGAHFVLGAFVAIIWCFERVFIRSASGRFRINVLGVIHATTLEFIGLYNSTYINAEVVTQLLKRLAKRFKDKPIFIVLDNARYQHCRLVKDLAQDLGITLVFLPPYSPNLNLIERLWKFIKKQVCHGKYYETSDSFQNAIVECLNNLHKNPSNNKLRTLLKPHFQLFHHAQNLAA